MPQISVEDVLHFLGEGAIWKVGRQSGTIGKPIPLHHTSEADGISFCSAEPAAAAKAISESRAAFIVCRHDVDYSGLDAAERTIVGVANPRQTFIRIVSKYFVPERRIERHPSAVISPNSALAEDVCIGPLAYVGDCSIGAGSRIHGHVHIADGTEIGRNVTIYAGTVIGADGFGYERNQAGELEKFPHLGKVVIEDDVEIGANCCVDRGTLGDTIIGRGTKIDNLVQVAHNVTIGRNCVITASTMIAGSAKIGDATWIAPASAVNNKIAAGRNAMVGIGSVVVRDVPDNAFVAGFPARAVPSGGTR